MESETFVRASPPAVHALTALTIVHAGLQGLDLLTTYLALSNGGVEANPISAAILASGWPAYIAVKAVVALVFIAMIPMLRSLLPSEARWIGAMMAGFAVFMAVVVVNNALIAA